MKHIYTVKTKVGYKEITKIFETDDDNLALNILMEMIIKPNFKVDTRSSLEKEIDENPWYNQK